MRRTKVICVILVVAIVFLVPFMIDTFVFGNQISSNVSNEAWASFFGSYIGGICTMLAVFITIWDNNRKMQEQQRKSDEKERDEKRISIRPFLDTRFTYFYEDIENGANDRIFDMENEQVKRVRFELNELDRRFIRANSRNDSHMVFIKYEIRNIGAGSAVDMTAKINNFEERVSMAKNETIQFLIFENMQKNEPVDVRIDLRFSDVEGRGEYQKIDCIQISFDANKEIVSKMTENGRQVLCTNIEKHE